MVIIPDLRNGAVKIYETQKPEKLDKQTNGKRIKIIFIDSFRRFKIPVKTNENIKIGIIKTMESFINKLIAYKFDFIERSIKLPKQIVPINKHKTKKGKFKNFLIIKHQKKPTNQNQKEKLVTRSGSVNKGILRLRNKEIFKKTKESEKHSF